MVYLFIFVGGAIGGGLRYTISLLFENIDYPMATLLVNVIGTFFMGLCASHLKKFFNKHVYLNKLLTTGFLGALTTFSSFSLETLRLFQHEKIVTGFIYIFVSYLLGIIFMTLGYKKGNKSV